MIDIYSQTSAVSGSCNVGTRKVQNKIITSSPSHIFLILVPHRKLKQNVLTSVMRAGSRTTVYGQRRNTLLSAYKRGTHNQRPTRSFHGISCTQFPNKSLLLQTTPFLQCCYKKKTHYEGILCEYRLSGKSCTTVCLGKKQLTSLSPQILSF